MKLIIAIVNSEDASAVLSELTRQGFSVTKLATSGGFLRAGNVTMMIGVEEEQVQKALSVIEEFSSQRKQQVPVNSTYIGDSMITVPVEVTVGGATVFVLDVEQFYKL
ncbi:MAG TPA: cyclic-di-AMP receptor [Candidatus Fimenecus excrementavium]|nr:cyclic-di-AMP receptor [Candidatus Fimenecus excrementavium]